MTEQEEIFIHFASCVAWLNNAWRLLQVIRDQSQNPLVGASFRYALVEYYKPYTSSHGATRKSFKLDAQYVPAAYLDLHSRIILARHQVHAHADLTVMDAVVSVHEYMGKRYSLILQNLITGLEELLSIDQVIALIEGTLDAMYLHEKILENDLPITMG